MATCSYEVTCIVVQPKIFYAGLGTCVVECAQPITHLEHMEYVVARAQRLLAQEDGGPAKITVLNFRVVPTELPVAVEQFLASPLVELFQVETFAKP